MRGKREKVASGGLGELGGGGGGGNRVVSIFRVQTLLHSLTFSFSIFPLAVSFPQTESSQARASLAKRFKSPWRKETHKISPKFLGSSIS